MKTILQVALAAAFFCSLSGIQAQEERKLDYF